VVLGFELKASHFLVRQVLLLLEPLRQPLLPFLMKRYILHSPGFWIPCLLPLPALSCPGWTPLDTSLQLPPWVSAPFPEVYQDLPVPVLYSLLFLCSAHSSHMLICWNDLYQTRHQWLHLPNNNIKSQSFRIWQRWPSLLLKAHSVSGFCDNTQFFSFLMWYLLDHLFFYSICKY
jgi:hypothetical protein